MAQRSWSVQDAKNRFSEVVEAARRTPQTVTKHGKPAGLLVGFASEDDWFDYRLEHDPRFLGRIAQARDSLRAGKGVRLEDIQPGRKGVRRRTSR